MKSLDICYNVSIGWQTVVESQGGISELAKQTGIPPQTLLEMLSGDVLPQIDILVSVLNALGCQISIQPIEVMNRGPEPASEDSSIAPIEAANSGLELPAEN